MEMARPAGTSTQFVSAPPSGYQTPGTATIIEKDASKVCLRAGSATVEVTALAPDLFRVGLFPHGRSACYSSEAVVSRDWEPGSVSVQEGIGEVTIATSFATAHLSLDPLRIGFSGPISFSGISIRLVAIPRCKITCTSRFRLRWSWQTDRRGASFLTAQRVSSLTWLAKILNGLGSEPAMETSSTMCSVGRPLRMSWRATQT